MGHQSKTRHELHTHTTPCTPKHASFWHPILAPLHANYTYLSHRLCCPQPLSYCYTVPANTHGQSGRRSASKFASRDGEPRWSLRLRDNHGGCSINTNYDLRHLRNRALALADTCACRTSETAQGARQVRAAVSTCGLSAAFSAPEGQDARLRSTNLNTNALDHCMQSWVERSCTQAPTYMGNIQRSDQTFIVPCRPPAPSSSDSVTVLPRLRACQLRYTEALARDPGLWRPWVRL